MRCVTDNEFPTAAYKRLAEFRYRLRQFLHFSEEAAREQGIEPQQHQLLLAIRGLPEGMRPSVTTLSARMHIRHHSTVELIDRSVEAGTVLRRHHEQDRREVLVELTPKGERILRALSALHWKELKITGPALSEALGELVGAVVPHRERQ